MSRIVRYAELWAAMLTRLTTTRMTKILGGGRVYTVNQDYSTPEGALDVPWGRLVLVPTQTAWPDADAPGLLTKVSLLVRGEMNGSFHPPGYIHQVALDALQDEVFLQLNAWVPADMQYIAVRRPFFLQRQPQPMPMWDDTRKLYFTSSEWRTEVVNVG